MQETCIWSLGQADPLEEEMATHSSFLAWEIPRMEEPDRLESVGSQRVGHRWALVKVKNIDLSDSQACPFHIYTTLFFFHFLLLGSTSVTAPCDFLGSTNVTALSYSSLRHEGRPTQQMWREEKPPGQFWLLVLCFFLLRLSLPYVNWASQEVFVSPEVITPVLWLPFVLFSQAFPLFAF